MTLIVALASVAGVIVALATVVVALRGVRDQLWLQTFSEYTRRYGEIVRELPSEARRPGGHFVFDELDTEEQGRVLNIARAYLNLCSEEYFLHSRGRIDDETWAIWQGGIVEVFRAPWIQSTWTMLKPEYDFFEFCSFLDDCIDEARAAASASATTDGPPSERNPTTPSSEPGRNDHEPPGERLQHPSTRVDG
jgi:hypothetical protein